MRRMNSRGENSFITDMVDHWWPAVWAASSFYSCLQLQRLSKSPVSGCLTCKSRLPFAREWESLRARGRWRTQGWRTERRASCPPTARPWGLSSFLLSAVLLYSKIWKTCSTSIEHVPIFFIKNFCYWQFPANETCPSKCCVPLMPTAQGLLQGDIESVLIWQIQKLHWIIFPGISCWQHQGNQMDQNLSHEYRKIKL